ncbi:MAG: ankyrin repeat domain-containing protein [Rickettsia endosymbiont of Pentastiridius leporinus]
MHKSFSFKALRDSFKTEKHILKEEIIELIKTNKINEIDPVHGTALNRAIKLQNKKIITELLSKNAAIDQAIYFAVSNQYTLKEIKELIALSSSKLPNDCLYKAVHQGRLDLVIYFIEEKDFDVNTTINNPIHGGAILSIAIMKEHNDIINYLLEKGAIPSQGVISATIKGNVKILEKLFEYGATANDDYSEDPVALAVCGAITTYDPNHSKASGFKTEQELIKYVETLKFLLEHDGNPNSLILEKGPVVLIALAAFIAEPKNLIYKDICKLLIKHKADTSKLKSYTETINSLNAEIMQNTRLEDTSKSKFFSLDEIEGFKENQTTLGGDIKSIFYSEL